MTTFLEISTFFEQLENISSRLELRDKLGNFLYSLTPTEGAITTYFITGRLAPKFVDAEFAVSEKTIIHVLEDLLAKSETEIKRLKQEYNDYGNIFKELTQHKIQKSSLPLATIYEKLWDIVKATGKGSQKIKFDLLKNLLSSTSPVEGKFIIRIILGRMRLGISERTILDAISIKTDAPKQARQIAEKAFGLTSDIGYVSSLFIQNSDLDSIMHKSQFTPGIPIAAKLVEREKTIKNVFKRIPTPYEEPKYDGLRCQAHIYKTEELKSLSNRIWYKYTSSRETLRLSNSADSIHVKLFSRNLESLTSMFPEIVRGFKQVGQALFQRYPNAKAFVFDGEVVGFNPNTNEFSPFTDTMTRRRKYNVDEAATETPVKIFTFDVIFWDKTALLDTPLRKRKELLEKIRDIHPDIILTPTHTPQTPKKAEQLFLDYVSEGLEGVIFKDPNSLYTPGLRRFDWIKFKRAMKKELADTIDVVALGYYYGTGKWAKFGIGAILVGIYDEKKDRYLTITKVGTGITEEQWKMLKKTLDQYKISRQLPNVEIPKQLMPDVLLEPAVVMELEADEITKSPTHSAGFALRFPRFKRLRDKDPTQTTSLHEIQEMFSETRN